MDSRIGDIETRAYFIWEQEGRPEGKDLDHWLRAEADIEPKLGNQPRKKASQSKRRSAAKK